MTDHHTAYDTDASLAAACGVNRRRIYKWRNEPLDPAPAGLDAAAWLDWLHRHGKRKAHAALTAHIAGPASPSAGGPVAPPAANPPAPHAMWMEDLDADAPPAGVDLPKQEAWWKAKAVREKALLAARQRQIAEGDLVPVAIVRRALANLATAAIESLGQTVWQRLRPALDGLATERPDLIRRLRAEHDAAITAIRTTLAAEVPQALTKAFTNQEAP